MHCSADSTMHVCTWQWNNVLCLCDLSEEMLVCSGLELKVEEIGVRWGNGDEFAVVRDLTPDLICRIKAEVLQIWENERI